jgi:ABC-type polysaccharide/polyol phosphate transport system ATPase subunit
VLASHSSDLIREMCSHAVLMQAGRIIEFGTVEGILVLHAKMCEV